MKTTINDAIRPLLEELQVVIDKFNYFEDSNEYISENSFTIDDLPEDFYIVIKLNDTKDTGTVTVSTTDGVDYFIDRVLGVIGLENDNWVIK